MEFCFWIADADGHDCHPNEPSFKTREDAETEMAAMLANDDDLNLPLTIECCPGGGAGGNGGILSI